MDKLSSSNVLSRGAFYKQHPWLPFVNLSLERRYLLENSYSFKLSSLKIAGFSVALGGLVLNTFLQDFLKACYLLSALAVLAVASTGNLRRQLALWMALVPILCESVDTVQQTLVAYLPTFAVCGVLMKDWRLCASSLCLSSILTLLQHTPSLASIGIAFGVYTCLSALIERDSREHWVKADIFRRKCLVHTDLFSTNESAVLVTTAKTLIIYQNKKARALVKRLQSTEFAKVDDFNALANKYGANDVLKKAVEQCLRGETVEFELILNHKVKDKSQFIGAYVTRVCPLSWNQANCVRISLADISTIHQQRSLTLLQTKETIMNLKLALRVVDTTYANNEPLISKDVFMLHSVHQSFLHVLSMQMFSMNFAEIAMARFNLKHEIIANIQASAYRALMRDVEIKLNYEANLPKVVIGDSDRVVQLFNTLLEFTAKQAKAKSTIQIVCECHVRPKQTENQSSTTMKLTFGFVTCQLSQDELRYLFEDSNRGKMPDVTQITQLYGIGIALFPLLLKVLSGRVLVCNMQESTVSRGYLAIL